MNKKGNVLGVMIVVGLFLVIGLMGFIAYQQGMFSNIGGTSESGVSGQTQTVVNQVAEASKAGTVSSVGVYVRDVSATDVNSKVAVPIYCYDTSSGDFMIDGTTSSTSAETTGKATIGDQITCYAFNSTFQTKTPLTFTVEREAEHKVIDAFRMPLGIKIQFYTDTYATGTGGQINVTVSGTNSQGMFTKMRVTNNNSNTILPVGGIYFSTVPLSNISDIDVSGSATIFGGNHASTNIVRSTLKNDIVSRRDNWDYVFELNDPTAIAGNTGNQPLFLEQNDYFETGSVSVKSASGCAPVGEIVQASLFIKGYYRSTTSKGVAYGYETDASPASLLNSADFLSDTFYCKG